MTDYTKIAKDISDAIEYVSKQGWKISYKSFDSVNKTVDLLSAIKLFDLKYVFAENYTDDELNKIQSTLNIHELFEFYPDLTLRDCLYFILICDRLKAKKNISQEDPDDPEEAVKCFSILKEIKKIGTYNNVITCVV